MIANGDTYLTKSEKMFEMRRTDTESLECKFRVNEQRLLVTSKQIHHKKLHTTNTDNSKSRRLFQIEILQRYSLV